MYFVQIGVALAMVYAAIKAGLAKAKDFIVDRIRNGIKL